MIFRALTFLLGWCARAIVQKYRPRIVAITGSVGKTTTCSAVAAALSRSWRLRASAKNYNNELGVPLTIIGADAPGSSPFAWCGIFLKAFWLLAVRTNSYPLLLVVEMGADHPGDIAHLIKIAPPDVGVLTAVSPAHTEFFGSVAGVLAEKKLIPASLRPSGVAVLNVDDELVNSIVGEISCRVVTVGASDAADVRVEYELTATGTRVHVYADEDMTFNVHGVLGAPVAHACAMAIAVAQSLGCSSAQIRDGLFTFQPPSGRMRLLDGVKRTKLIDDTYNASPRAAREALEALAKYPTAGRRIAVLGDMRELGALSDKLHEEIGALIVSLQIDLLITVGADARFFARGARAAVMSEDRVFSFDAPYEAGKFLQERMQEGDLILIKGSQGIRCEKIVKEVMAEPERAGELLVRQGKGWK